MAVAAEIRVAVSVVVVVSVAVLVAVAVGRDRGTEMTRAEFLETWLPDTWSPSCAEILRRKGADYADAGDVFDSFKRHAATLGVSPEVIWSVYASKHWDAILTYVRTGAVQSEPILDRLRDLRNYVDLIAAHISGEQKS